MENNGSTKAINECASLLAQVDDESYQRAILQDASCILERIVFPMCFPWNHSIIPAIKNFPKDIDELPAILHVGEEEYTPFDNGVFGYGGFEVGKERRSTRDEAAAAHGESFLAATRRTNDVGVIELTVIDNEGNIDKSSLLRKRSRQEDSRGNTTGISITASDKVPNENTSNVDSQENGVARMPPPGPSRISPSRDTEESQDASSITAADLVFVSHEHSKAAKKQKLKASEGNAQRILVSVRCGSVSSRSSIFAPKEGTTPLLCKAVLATTNRKKHNDVVGFNGEWDADRAKFLKKDTLSWTQSVSGGYESILSYNTMTSVAAKKPREVQVGVRLNGELLSCQPGETLEDALERLSSSDSAIHGAVQGETSMCMIDCDLVMENFVKVNMRRNVSPSKPPRLDCVPVAVTHDSIRVVCSAPGTLRCACITDLFRRHDNKCSVCWTTDGKIRQCLKCGVQAHTSCCSHGGVLVPTSTLGKGIIMSWMCAVCSEGPKQTMSSSSPRRRATNLPSRYQSDVLLGMGMHSQSPGFSSSSVSEGIKCNLCPHSGGAMSPVVGSLGGEWSHEVCRIWTRSSAVEMEAGIPRVIANCALCGLSDGSLIKCSGSCCTVRFHPMCALIGVVRDTEVHGPVAPATPATRDARDARLCNRFTLDIVECGDTVLPVGFCGFHNPQRDEFLYGCYPCGMGSAMRVPSIFAGNISLY